MSLEKDRDSFKKSNDIIKISKTAVQLKLNEAIIKELRESNESLKNEMKYLIICNKEMQIKLGNIVYQEDVMKRRIEDLEKAVKNLTNDKIWYQPYSKINHINSVIDNGHFKKRIDNLENKILLIEKEIRIKNELIYLTIYPETGHKIKLYMKTLFIRVEDLMKKYADIRKVNINSIEFYLYEKYLHPNKKLSACGIRSGDDVFCFNVRKG